MPDIKPPALLTYVFVPLEKGDWQVLDEHGNLTEWDGKTPAMCFISFFKSTVLYVDIPYRVDSLWQWQKTWKGYDVSLDNPWHYMRVPKTQLKEEAVFRRDAHPNEEIGRNGMRICSSRVGCANGRGPSPVLDNEWIRQGKLWRADTMEPVTPPKRRKCYLCANGMRGHLEHRICVLESYIQRTNERVKELETKLEEDKDNLEEFRVHAKETKARITERIEKIRSTFS